ncbi:MAG: DUF2339 domain-containing protein, partial [Pseudomonadota bacterium]
MEGLAILAAVLAVLVFIAGAICGIIAIVQQESMRSEIRALKRRLDEYHQALDSLRTADSKQASAAPADMPTTTVSAASVPNAPELKPHTPATTTESPTPAAPKPIRKSRLAPFQQWLTANWMVALGGLCVALAGIFMVRYSIEKGLLGPTARVVLAFATGLALNGAAEWLRRKQGEAHPALAALAGGGSITLYAAVLAALSLYQLIAPGVAFVLLAAISFATLLLAILYGPVLAVMGILGAYIVPILVSTDSGNVTMALAYVLIVSCSGLWLLRYVYRPWLWIGILIGALGWFAIALLNDKADVFRGFYLLLFSYAVLSIRHGDWLLTQSLPATEPTKSLSLKGIVVELHAYWLQLALIITLGAAVTQFALREYSLPIVTASTLQIALIYYAVFRKPALYLLASASLIVSLAGAFTGLLHTSHDSFELMPFLEPLVQSQLLLAGAMAVVFGLGSLFVARAGHATHLFLGLACCGPVLWMVFGYMGSGNHFPKTAWAIVAGMYALVLMHLATRQLFRQPNDNRVAWAILGAHMAFATAMAILLR